GMGAGCAMAMSGIDMALWDIRGKAVGWPLYRLLGGAQKPIPAYAGGVSLGYQDPSALVDEARPHLEAGYRAIKLRVGDSPRRDLARIEAVRKAAGDDIDILVDANTAYSVKDARAVMPAMDELNVGWLEEPFPPHDHRSYQLATSFGQVPLASGENHFTRFEFNRVIEDGAITILQPDISKTGRHHRAVAHRRDGVRLQAADQSAHLHDRPEHGGDDPRARRDRQRRVFRGRRVAQQSVPR
ncbi:MAG: hypothetical protein V7604_4023, partial [Hyphomicrobiales bacterium]